MSQLREANAVRVLGIIFHATFARAQSERVLFESHLLLHYYEHRTSYLLIPTVTDNLLGKCVGIP